MVTPVMDEAAARQVLETVPDPEIPVISVCDLGIVREVRTDNGSVEVVVTPTYSGCPATEAIERAMREALEAAGAQRVIISTRLSPPWSTDWISPRGRDRLREHGIVPPGPLEAGAAAAIRIVPRLLTCPRCGSNRTEQLSAFGSTACKSLWRCHDCREPFEHFKPI